MISPRWRKVLSDIWGNKTRTILVVLSIALGVFAVGAVAHMNLIVGRDLADSYASINPANAVISVADSFTYGGRMVDEDMVRSLRKVEGIRDIEGRQTIVMRFKYGEQDDWHPILIIAVPDYENIRINRVEQEIEFGPDPAKWPTGAWPPPQNEIVLERTSLLLATMGLTHAERGDSIIIQTPDKRERVVRMAGLCYDFARIPATFGGMAYGYVTFDTLEWLGGPRGYSELYLTVNGDPHDLTYVREVAKGVRTKLEKSGFGVSSIVVNEPGKLPLSDTFRTITLVMGVVGGFSLFLGGFLIINTISAVLAQQTRQIGMMKAIGAQTPQIMGMYLTMVLLFGALAIMIAIPLGIFAAREFINFLSYFLNFRLTEFHVPPQVIILEVGVGLLVPLMAAVWPVISGTRVTVREALTSYGLGKGTFGTGRIDRLLEQLRGLPRPFAISLRNTFRRKGRLALTMVTLILACALFMAVLSVRASLFLTIGDFLDYFAYDAQIALDRPYRTVQLRDQAAGVPGITLVEYINGSNTYRIRADETEGSRIQVIAVEADTVMFKPHILEGRWLLPDDENALVVNTEVIKNEPDIRVGDEIILRLQGRETRWQVVGVFQSISLVGNIAHASNSYYTRLAGIPGQAGSIAIQTEQHDEQSQNAVTRALDEHFKKAGIGITYVQTSSAFQNQIRSLFDIITTLLSSMALLIGAVGGLGLMGTMSINVLERTREIGVMRAIGADNGAVQQIVMTEGILIGVLSWLIGLALAAPLGKLLSDAIGMGFLNGPPSYTFSWQGTLICLAGVIILAAAASYAPAQNAARLTVREVLAYE